MKDWKADPETHSIKDNWLFAQEEEGTGRPQKETFPCQPNSPKHEFVESIISIQNFLGRIG